MGTTGIVRKLDELGRIVLPMELRKTLDLKVKDSIEISVEKGAIILRKFSQSCIFCGKETKTANFKGKTVCSKCLEEIKTQLD